MSSLWDDIRKTVKDGINVVTDRTDEYAKIGRIKVDIAGINHNISKLFSELGGRVYHLYSTGEGQKIMKDTEVVNLLTRIKAQEDKLRKNENDIKRIKKEKEQERKKKSVASEAKGKTAEAAKSPAAPAEKSAAKTAAKPATKPAPKKSTGAKPSSTRTKKTTAAKKEGETKKS